MNVRIKAIDGFRAVAILGVLWAHVWMFFGNPSFVIFHVNVAALISFFGTGVDLFFVISGFCMYLMYLSKSDTLDWSSYFEYIKKRWLRIAPVFYVAILVYGMYEVGFNMMHFDLLYALKLALFIRNLFPEPTQYAPHFWSLGTEWQFYLMLPFIVLLIKRFSFIKGMLGIIGLCLLLRLLFWSGLYDDPFNILNFLILNRLIEFVMGLLAARFFLEGKKGWLFESNYGLLSGIAIALAGRVLMSAFFNYRNDIFGIAARVLDLPLLSMGYALVIINVLQYKTILTSALESRAMTLIGKYSYSMYLWHWMVAVVISHSFQSVFADSGFIGVNIVFVVCLILLYPLSMLSYRILESFYFKQNKKV